MTITIHKWISLVTVLPMKIIGVLSLSSFRVNHTIIYQSRMKDTRTRRKKMYLISEIEWQHCMGKSEANKIEETLVKRMLTEKYKPMYNMKRKGSGQIYYCIKHGKFKDLINPKNGPEPYKTYRRLLWEQTTSLWYRSVGSDSDWVLERRARAVMIRLLRWKLYLCFTWNTKCITQ